VETLERYLAQLASSSPTPGGGSAATVVAATGAALVAMVGRIYSESPRYAQFHELATRTADSADALRVDLAAARERDERAFSRVMAAHALPKETDAEKAARAGVVEKALHAAAAEPLQAAALALDVIRFASQLTAVPNRNLASDLGCAAEFGYSALAACAYNVRINHRFMRDTEAIAAQANLLARYESEANALLAAVRRSVAEALAR
jgi:formiminotetrahydrofolate cyclodeaminase